MWSARKTAVAKDFHAFFHEKFPFRAFQAASVNFIVVEFDSSTFYLVARLSPYNYQFGLL